MVASTGTHPWATSAVSGPRPAHLTRRGAVYVARFRIPADLAQRVGVRELKRSLGVSDYREARRRCLRATMWFAALIDDLRLMSEPSRADFEAAARAYFAELEADPKFASIPVDDLDHELPFQLEANADRLAKIESLLRSRDYREPDGPYPLELSERAGVRLSDLTPVELTRLQHTAARLERTALQLAVHRLTEPPWKPFASEDELFQPVLPLVEVLDQATSADATQTDALSGVQLADAVARYLRRRQRDGVGTSALGEQSRALGWMVEAFGAETNVSTISQGRVRWLRDEFERLDGSYRGRRDVSFAERLTNDPARRLQVQTTRRYWQAVQSFLRWLWEEGFAHADLGEKLRISGPARPHGESPEAFSQDELGALFRAPLYAGHRGRFLNAPGECRSRGAQWWIGLLGLYTGMRAGEIAQLEYDDFRFDHDPPLIRVSAEGAGEGGQGKRLKTRSSQRVVPIARTLLDLGLREFIDRRKARWGKSSPRPFREVRLGQGDRRSDGVTKFWLRLLKEQGLHKPGRAFHVMRHTAAAAMRRAGVQEEAIGAVLGHAPTSMSGKYGGQYPIERLHDAVESIDYGIDVIEAVGGPYDPSLHDS